jgi:hypothetical protein
MPKQTLCPNFNYVKNDTKLSAQQLAAGSKVRQNCSQGRVMVIIYLIYLSISPMGKNAPNVTFLHLVKKLACHEKFLRFGGRSRPWGRNQSIKLNIFLKGKM